MYSVFSLYLSLSSANSLLPLPDLSSRCFVFVFLSSILSRVFVSLVKDVASGMAYLSQHGLQHRNLHSHNVLITKEWGAKVRRKTDTNVTASGKSVILCFVFCRSLLVCIFVCLFIHLSLRGR